MTAFLSETIYGVPWTWWLKYEGRQTMLAEIIAVMREAEEEELI